MHRTDTIAFEAAAALDAYGEQLQTVCRYGAQPYNIARMQQELRRVCDCCVQLPQLSAPGMALLLAHHRLLAVMAREGTPMLAEEGASSVRSLDRGLALMQRRCRELFRAAHLH